MTLPLIMRRLSLLSGALIPKFFSKYRAIGHTNDLEIFVLLQEEDLRDLSKTISPMMKMD